MIRRPDPVQRDNLTHGRALERWVINLTREETQRILMGIQVLYPSYKVDNSMKTATVDMWTEMLSDMTYEQVQRAVREFSATDNKGFAPVVGQIRDIIAGWKTDIMDEGVAWLMVYQALGNGYYGAEIEFNKLPDDIRRALGGASQLRQWSMMDADDLSVAESNFKRQYREVIQRRQKLNRIPEHDRIQIESAPVAMIEEKTKEETGTKRASEEFVARLLEKWRAEADDFDRARAGRI